MEAWRAHAKAKSHSASRRGAKSSRGRVRPLSVPDAKRLIGGGFPYSTSLPPELGRTHQDIGESRSSRTFFAKAPRVKGFPRSGYPASSRSEEHTSELQSL